MKKIEDLYFTVSIVFSSAQNFEQLHFFLSTAQTYVRHTFSVEQMAFFCRAVEIPKKSVEQSRFEQMDFEQLTLTPINYFLIIIFTYILRFHIYYCFSHIKQIHFKKTKLCWLSATYNFYT